ncbi:MAG: hypothetical protein ACYCO3_06975 [Mycobacteriales bacterium]
MASVNTKIEQPFYAVAGAGDLALKKLRELVPNVQQLPTNLQRVPGSLLQAPAAFAQLPANVQSQVDALRDHGRRLSDRAGGMYEALTERGRRAVKRESTGASSKGDIA